MIHINIYYLDARKKIHQLFLLLKIILTFGMIRDQYLRESKKIIRFFGYYMT